MHECIFCKIIRRELPAEIVFEDEEIIAFKDIHPKAPVHVLIVPKEHFVNLNDAGEARREVLARLLLRVADVAHQQGIAESGYKVVANNGTAAGQLVDHFHFHLLGGGAVTNMP